jgi:ABC-type multidrug transport system ATPase subunit
MDVLAGRKTGGRVTGTQMLNGHPKDMATFARVMGYVEQMDVHMGQATVCEALIFSALLRLGRGVDRTRAIKFVDEVMNLVELQPQACKMIGSIEGG